MKDQHRIAITWHSVEGDPMQTTPMVGTFFTLSSHGGNIPFFLGHYEKIWPLETNLFRMCVCVHV
jgi:hypothetical protein